MLKETQVHSKPPFVVVVKEVPFDPKPGSKHTQVGCVLSFYSDLGGDFPQ